MTDRKKIDPLARIHEIREPLRSSLVQLVNTVASHGQSEGHERALSRLVSDYRRYAEGRQPALRSAVVELERCSDEGTWGWPRVDVVAFNIDGEGTALLRIYTDDGPQLQVRPWGTGDDMELLLGDDDEGHFEYRERTP